MSLLEVVVALAISSLLMVAIGSAVVMASHALPDRSSPTLAGIHGGRTLQHLAAELETALFMIERDARTVSFTVPDRTGDGRPQVVRYSWSGTPGDPLQRQYDGGPPVDVLDQVRHLHLTYDVRTVSETIRGTGIEDPQEQLLAAVGDFGGFNEQTVTSSRWVGQYFLPDRARVGLSWRPTRARARFRPGGWLSGSVHLELHNADGGMRPSGTVLASSSLSYHQLLAYLYVWRDMPISGVQGLAPDQGVCFVVRHQQGSVGAYVAGDDSSGPGFLRTLDAGGSWQYHASQSLHSELHGHVTMPGPPRSIVRRYLAGVGINLAVGPDDARRLRTTIATLNHPELLTNLWELDFTRNPTTVDLNGDGQGDWAVEGGGAFHTHALSGGVWQPTQAIHTQPQSDFTGLTTIELRCRAASVGGHGAVMAINADRSDGQAVHLVTALSRQADGSQLLRVFRVAGGGAMPLLAAAGGLPGGMVDLRLIIDPGDRSFNLNIDGVDRGSFTYQRDAVAGREGRVTLMALGATAQFEHVRIREGGAP
jgi:hypothetical protein